MRSACRWREARRRCRRAAPLGAGSSPSSSFGLGAVAAACGGGGVGPAAAAGAAGWSECAGAGAGGMGASIGAAAGWESRWTAGGGAGPSAAEAEMRGASLWRRSWAGRSGRACRRVVARDENWILSTSSCRRRSQLASRKGARSSGSAGGHEEPEGVAVREGRTRLDLLRAASRDLSIWLVICERSINRSGCKGLATEHLPRRPVPDRISVPPSAEMSEEASGMLTRNLSTKQLRWIWDYTV